MRTEARLAGNPFALMMQPEAVLRTVARPASLRRLRLHKYLLLDEPQLRRLPADDEPSVFDTDVDVEALLAVTGDTDANGFPTLVN